MVCDERRADRGGMPTTARLMLGAMIVASDGLCGLVKSLLVDPSVPRVVHLVVEAEHRIGLGRLVPMELVCEVEEDAGNGIDLDCNRAEFGALPLAETSEVVRGVGAGYSYVRNPRRLTREVHDSVPKGEVPVRSGDPVVATDGQIGLVAGFDAEPPQHRIVQLLVNEHRFPWRHQTVALPVSRVTGFNAGVEVSLTLDQAAKIASVPRS
jgi:hypothetical protein